MAREYSVLSHKESSVIRVCPFFSFSSSEKKMDQQVCCSYVVEQKCKSDNTGAVCWSKCYSLWTQLLLPPAPAGSVPGSRKYLGIFWNDLEKKKSHGDIPVAAVHHIPSGYYLDRNIDILSSLQLLCSCKHRQQFHEVCFQALKTHSARRGRCSVALRHANTSLRMRDRSWCDSQHVQMATRPR